METKTRTHSRRQVKWSAFTSSILLVIFGAQFLSASALAPESDVRGPGAIWIAESQGALKIGTENGQHLLTIPSQEDVTAIALDTERRRVWLYSGRILAANDFDGHLERQLEVPTLADKPASLAVVPEDGSLWLGAGRLLLSIGFEGQVLREIHLDATIGELTLDAEENLLWVASGNRVTAYDAVAGHELRALTGSAATIDLDVDAESGCLWLARTDGLYRHDFAGQELFAATVESLAGVAGDDRGGLWLAAGPELLHLDSSGHPSASLSPFGAASKIDRLLFDGSHRTVWASDGRRLAKVSASGEILARLALEQDSQLFDLALQQGAPDQAPPLLELRQDDAEKTRRTIRIRYSDPASGVDPASFKLRNIPGSEDAFSCKTSVEGAHCTAAIELAAGTLIGASVSDHMGNLAEASIRLTDPGHPAEGKEGNGTARSRDASAGLTFPGAKAASLAGESVASLRGFLPHQPFLSDGEIEAINTVNGNVNLSIPLGQVYTVGPLLRYQLRVTHNSDAWSHATVACSSPNCPLIPTTLIALPQRANNAGIGWELHFGQLYPPQKPQGLDPLDRQTWPNNADPAGTESDSWLYVSPDGSSHTLHRLPGRTAVSVEGLPVRYSKDGSHLRMRQIDSDTVVVEHPNGLLSQFEQSNSSLGTLGCGGGVTGCWRFEEMRDHYGNKVWVNYIAETGGEKWRIEDSTGRVNRIFFKTDSASRRGDDTTVDNKLRLGNGDELGDLLRVVDKVEIAAVNNTIATYRFAYATETVQRSRPHDPRLLLGTASAEMTVPMLKSITVPHSLPYRFTHYSDFLKSGRIKQVTLPTRGKYLYDYGIWRFPTACVYTQTQEEVAADYFRYGISTKRHFVPQGVGAVATWTYTNSIHPAVAGSDRSGPTCKRAEFRRTQVDSPTVDDRFTRQELFTSVTQGPRFPSANDPIGSWQITDHGLPFDKGQRIGMTNADFLFLSEKVSDCIAGACAVKRKKFVRYAVERRACTALTIFRDPPSCFQIDPVLVRERTIFRDDGNKWIEKKNTHHTGAGHTQNTFTIDTFAASERTVEHRTDYEAGDAMPRPESATTGYIDMGTPSTYLPDLRSRWILTPFSKITLIDNGLTYVTTYDFDDKGVLTCRRKRRFPATDHPTDVVTTFTLGVQNS